jgi:endoglucanase
MVSGNGYDSASGWNDNWYGVPNGHELSSINDPLDKVVFEAHQYLDSDSSGTNPTCVSPTIGSSRLKAFTGWLRTSKKHGFLGEFGAGANETCRAAIDDMLAHVDAYSDVYVGWTWWAAGPWWGDYFSSIEPDGSTDKPQMAVLANHLH